jgi:hypothetical protein
LDADGFADLMKNGRARTAVQRIHQYDVSNGPSGLACKSSLRNWLSQHASSVSKRDVSLIVPASQIAGLAGMYARYWCALSAR